MTDRVLVIGLDGATWEALDPLMAEGRMPSFCSQDAGRSAFMLASSRVAMTSRGRGMATRAQGQMRGMREWICSNCHATFRAAFSLASEITRKFGLLTSIHGRSAAAAR